MEDNPLLPYLKEQFEIMHTKFSEQEKFNQETTALLNKILLYKKIDSLSKRMKSLNSSLDQNLLKPILPVSENLGELISPTSSITDKKGVGEINSPKTSLNDSSIQINSFDGSNTENLSPKFQINSINGSEFMDTPKPKSFSGENKRNINRPDVNCPKTSLVKYHYFKVIKIVSDIDFQILLATSLIAKCFYGLDKRLVHLLDELFYFYDLPP